MFTKKNFHPKNFHPKNFHPKKFSPKKIHPKIFTKIVRLSFVDLRWAQLYVSLVSVFFQNMDTERAGQKTFSIAFCMFDVFKKCGQIQSSGQYLAKDVKWNSTVGGRAGYEKQEFSGKKKYKSLCLSLASLMNKHSVSSTWVKKLSTSNELGRGDRFQVQCAPTIPGRFQVHTHKTTTKPGEVG